MPSPPQITRVAAYGLVLDGPQILLCRLSEQVTGSAGKWTLPGGGLEFGESPIEAMIREVEEETGLIVRARELAGVDSNVIKTPKTTYHNIRIVYHTEPVGGTLRHETDGSTDLCQWWHKDETPVLVSLGRVGIGLAFG